MPYGTGGTIEAIHFNGFVSNVANVWNTGSANLQVGYGQSGTISTVAVGGTVQASSWASLISRINTIRQHQSGVTSGFTSPATGNTIAWFNNMNTMVSSLVSNSLSFNNVQGSYVAPNASMTLNNTTGWTGTCTKELSIHWSSANAMRYFFNAGGEIRFGVENSLLTGNAKSADWDLLLNNMGRVRIRSNGSSRVSGSGGSLTTTAGFWNLGTTQTTVLTQTSGTTGYTANTGVLSLRLNAAAGSSNVMYVRFIGTDGATDVINDTVLGTVSFTVDFVPPSTTYLSNTWGTLTFGNLVATNTQV